MRNQQTIHDVWGVGIDLGKERDHTAMIAARFRALKILQTAPYPVIYKSSFSVQMVERLALGTTYAAVMDRILRVCETLTKSAPVYLIMDATGIGAPVVEAIENRLRKERVPYSMSGQGWQMGNNGVMLRPVVITGGDRATYDGVLSKVPKKDLVSRLALELEAGTLQFARDLPMLDQLFQEMSAFRSVMKSPTHTSFEAAGKEHDDLVLALALAVWFLRDRFRGYGDKTFSLGIQGG